MNFSRLLFQTAVYWASPAPDGYGGSSFSSPVEVTVRWEDRIEVFKTLQSEEEVSRAVVYSEVAFDVGGYLMLGTLNDLSSTRLPEEEETAFRIRATNSMPNLVNTQSLEKAWV